MRIYRYGIIWLLAGWLFLGCRPAENLRLPDSAPPGPTQAQPKLPTVRLWLGTEEMVTEIARHPIEIQTGMMFREQMAENESMLFIFAFPHRAAFWMRNTVLPLSCAYLDSEGVILEIHDLKPRDETPIEAETDRVRYVLETRQGWFDRHKIKTGTVIRAEKGSLEDTFFGKKGS